MRHLHAGKKLGMTAAHRKAMFSNMTVSLIKHEAVRTTLARAKELRRVIEPLVTLSRDDSVAARRRVFSRLRDQAAVAKLFADLGPYYRDRPGGYLRILKCGFRPGDKAPMAFVQFVGRPEKSDQ